MTSATLLHLLPPAEPLACSAAPLVPVEPMCSAGEVRFTHQFVVCLPHYAEPVRACADIHVHLGAPEVDCVPILPPGTIRKRAFDLMMANTDHGETRA